MTHLDYMKKAIKLAERGRGWTNPNPLVGCIIVKNNQIIAEGYHEKYGEWHAERNAILNCTKDLSGSTAYVTLEPCCHFGHTPPCCDLLIEKGINTVVIGSSDLNPLVAGKGIKKLREAGIEVIENIMKAQCDELNSIFFHYIQTKRPYVLLKYAMTVDGKIATITGQSKWITGEIARHQVQQTRHQYSAIMVGVDTILTDNPMLNCRLENTKQPVRIVCDSQLRTPLTSKLVQTAPQFPTIIATLSTDLKRHQQYQELGVEIITVSADKNKRCDLNVILQILGHRGIDSVLLEGGSNLNFSALQMGIVDLIHCYIAPKLIGGKTAKTPVGGLGVASLSDATLLKLTKTEIFDEDIRLTFEVKK
ncbi:bifunctional diaminohydroxyphosphoribosylaminopyrimidine deaminase/5-amino-6-(5-phosphoribosylamino)uracil reductase RibD [Pasteurella atlantica]|uniref:bifunctional diaminohydroxyphosphoribosylaminopyrimidine deaminase/5-amino-6-(5-phosphoribosylamino)uracil reductase RibD n=1 Tax=Pasteurellaceae TaxID=712 RepID=UPI0027743618|nr:bifunctional diaminohydroxyphosphoribosylaminopyrimidine deaminase/5-amino-6-(5-phosphoribosylamino)uracil reductase RibD [Pasteurella atlantica]MDP8099981.1 bifunctional diaminohydroxyphosphoribosylaminopyrimidine deaminase/5-amino-6-(5-phosphoribosylamino)uracil reductase RibD [Pasteurella atlantica]MDP8107831.1 bifunctional diaminohydroxyphosphoribosylaminopyrimidine deaminase/5-amino-6-(5-phosphoribosylamino)uracil reductase RibD [Pasteurella atlantica]MDP8117573.1 bifunctional diaminohyd